MNINLIDNIPIPDCDLNDWAISQQSSSNKGTLLLSYASARDFLSTPIAHTIVQFHGADDNDIQFKEFCVQDYFDFLDESVSNGLFQFSDDMEEHIDSSTKMATIFYPKNHCYLMICGDIVLEIYAERLEVIQQSYYFPSANAALEGFLVN